MVNRILCPSVRLFGGSILRLYWAAVHAHASVSMAPGLNARRDGSPAALSPTNRRVPGAIKKRKAPVLSGAFPRNNLSKHLAMPRSSYVHYRLRRRSSANPPRPISDSVAGSGM